MGTVTAYGQSRSTWLKTTSAFSLKLCQPPRKQRLQAMQHFQKLQAPVMGKELWGLRTLPTGAFGFGLARPCWGSLMASGPTFARLRLWGAMGPLGSLQSKLGLAGIERQNVRNKNKA